MSIRRKSSLSRSIVLVPLLIAFTALFTVSAQGPASGKAPAASARPYVWTDEPDGCTSIQVGRLASEDGSVMTAHTCHGNYRNWLTIVPHGKFPAGSKNKIFSGKMHTEGPADVRGFVQTGEIPQVAETFQFVNAAYPFMNEAGLAIGETTIGGRRELYNQEGMFMIEEIERIGRGMTYVEMNESREFMNGFMAARFLPHTDLDLFPSVRERLGKLLDGAGGAAKPTLCPVVA